MTKLAYQCSCSVRSSIAHILASGCDSPRFETLCVEIHQGTLEGDEVKNKLYRPNDTTVEILRGVFCIFLSRSTQTDVPLCQIRFVLC